MVEHGLLAHGSAFQNLTPFVNHSAEAGRRHLENPAARFQGSEAAGGHLLGLDLGQPVAGPVRRVEDDLRPVEDSVP